MASIIIRYIIKALVIMPVSRLLQGTLSVLSTYVRPEPILFQLKESISNTTPLWYLNIIITRIHKDQRKTFSKYLYLSGDFSAGYYYLLTMETIGRYNLLLNNCMQTSIEALKCGHFNKSNGINQLLLRCAQSMIVPSLAFEFLLKYLIR